MSDVEKYFTLIQKAVNEQVRLVGEAEALEQARRSGLGISPAGHVIGCVGDPALVLLRLVKNFVESGNLAALTKCMPLVDEMGQIRAAVEQTGA